jgi:hypothetical protein
MSNRLTFRLLIPRRYIPAAAHTNGSNGRGPWRKRDDCAAVEIVSTAVAALPEGVIVAGSKEQLAPLGRPEQAKLTAELKPYWGVTVRVTVPELPDWTVSEAGEVVS